MTTNHYSETGINAPEVQDTPRPTYKILVVDDYPGNANTIVKILRETSEPYKILKETDELNALETAKNTIPDLIIVGCGAMERSGIQSVESFKKEPSIKDIPLIITAGAMCTHSHLRSALEAGAYDYIRSPIDPVEMATRVHAALLLRDSYKEIHRRKEELENLSETLFLLNDTLEEKNQELYKAVITDSLTGIYNRGFLMETLSKEFSRSKRHDLNLSCVMMDIDHFKSINDDYGHQVGDFILKEAATRIQDIIRHEDIFGRYGGEEFLLILPNSTESNSRVAAEKVRFAIESSSFNYQDLTLEIRASFGVADNRIQKPKNADELINQADKALYEAKRTGRNKTVTYSQLCRQSQ